MRPDLPYTHLARLKKLRERLIEIRKERGMTQAQVGEMLGFHSVTICRLETGQASDFRISTLDRWAVALGCTLEYTIKVGDRPKRVDHRALKRETPAALTATPEALEGAHRQALPSLRKGDIRRQAIVRDEREIGRAVEIDVEAAAESSPGCAIPLFDIDLAH